MSTLTPLGAGPTGGGIPPALLHNSQAIVALAATFTRKHPTASIEFWYDKHKIEGNQVIQLLSKGVELDAWPVTYHKVENDKETRHKTGNRFRWVRHLESGPSGHLTNLEDLCSWWINKGSAFAASV